MKGSSDKKDVKRWRVSHLQLRNWRNFLKVDVDLQRRVFLVGANASGKSNFLDVFKFLHDIASVGGGFQAAVANRGGVSSIRSLAARKKPEISLLVRIGNGDQSFIWEYELQFSQDNLRRPIIKKEKVSSGEICILSRPTDDDIKDPERLTQTALEQIHVNREFREVADFFESVRYLHIVPQLVREPDRSVGRKNDPYGGDFLEQLASASPKIRDSRLRQIQDALRVAVPQLKGVELNRDSRGTPHLRGKYEHWRPQGAWQTEDQFSDGTLRLMGLLWASLEGSGPLLLEEPELSLHAEVVRFMPQMFARVQRRSGRQILLSTHSADLLQDEGIGLDEVLLLLPSAEGTAIAHAKELSDIDELLQGGMSLADVVIPKTRPKGAEQLSLFGEY
jgi:predicted ATPase